MASSMANVAPSDSGRHSPSRALPARHPIARLGRHWDSLVLLLLVLASFPGTWLAPKSLVPVWHAGIIDDNWHLDEMFKLSRGIWVGRDVAFTHGPIFQWLSSLPARTMGLSMGAMYATWVTVPVWCAFLLTYLTLRLLLPSGPPADAVSARRRRAGVTEYSAWKRAFLLLLLCMFWEPNLRTSFAILLFAVFLRGWYAVAEGQTRHYWLGASAAVLCGTAFLVATDTGTYALAAWVLSLAGAALEFRRDRRVLGSLALTLLSFVVAAAVVVVAINVLLGKPLDFHFWKDSLEMVRAYRWATAFPMTDPGTIHLLGALLLGAAIFLLRAFSRRREGLAITARTGFLAGSFLFCLAVMQSGLVRSDYGHTVTAVLAMVVFAGMILFSFGARSASLLAIFVAIVCSLSFGELAFRPAAVAQNFAPVLHPLTECPAGFEEFDRTCFQPTFAQMLGAASGFVQQHSGPGDSILVFPFQTLFGKATQRNVAGGLIQPYTASGPYLSQLEIAALKRAAPLTGLYFTDPDMRYLSGPDLNHWRELDLSLPVDGVSNFTRTPEVWFWMQRHYRAEQQLAPGLAGLQRDEARAARISLQPQPLGVPARTYLIHERSSATDLELPYWPNDADFLRLRLTVRYPVWWKLRKPERMQLELTFANGSTDLQWFVLEPNVSSEVWFYPWSPPELARYFEAEESQWHPASRPAITRLRILATPWDWVSVTPEAIVVEAADAVRVELNH
jgi:hypothetical protein